MTKKVLPQKVYVYIICEGNGEWWLAAETTVEGCAEKGKKHLVGVYELKEKLNVEVKEELLVEKAG